MDYFQYQADEAFCEGVPLQKLAEEVDTPAYIYSAATLDRHCRVLKETFKNYPTLLCYAVKANHNLTVLGRIFAAGFGADVVSVGELERALRAGVRSNEIVFSGVGKQAHEIERGLMAGILSFNVEYAGELDEIARLAAKFNRHAGISLRINPNIDAKTNPYIATGLYGTKFGIAESDAKPLLRSVKGSPHLRLLGLACHIGSQIVELGPFREAATRLVQLSRELMEEGFPLQTIDLGGGLGIRYKSEQPPPLEDYAATLLTQVESTGLKLLIEPGRAIVGNAGVLLTRVIGIKITAKKRFVIVDGAMNDLIRPSLYKSYHEILSVRRPTGTQSLADVVGPICETSDFLGVDRQLPDLRAGDLLFVRGCGAYGSTMASNYNTRPRAAEVLVEGSTYSVIRRRESLQDLWVAEEP